CRRYSWDARVPEPTPDGLSAARVPRPFAMADNERAQATNSNLVGAFVQARYFAADARWLGVLRIGFGGLLAWDSGPRFAGARAHYSNEGFLPNHFALFRPMGDGVFSFLHAFSSLAEVRAVMALMLVAFVSFTLGYRTKLAHFLAFISITSLDARDL